nr:hypothetical protein [Methanobacterium formicicum]
MAGHPFRPGYGDQSRANHHFFSATGAILSAIAITILGENLRARLVKWKYGDETALKETRMYNLWNKYGIIGLGLLSPLIFGAPLGAAVGIALGAEKKKALYYG